MGNSEPYSNIESFGYQGDEKFERTYLEVRQKEGRVYSDDLVANLPVVPENRPHALEWKKRNESCKRLLNYLEKKKYPLTVLEVGCGNGWLSNKVASCADCKVVACDINLYELRQGQRLFANNPNITFVRSDVFYLADAGLRFDIILFASSIQYFESIPELVNIAKRLLNTAGELHILDSPFYESTELSAAVERTRQYYAGIGFPEMAQFYFHHSLEELEQLKFEILYSPGRISQWLNRDASPFYWFCRRQDQ